MPSWRDAVLFHSREVVEEVESEEAPRLLPGPPGTSRKSWVPWWSVPLTLLGSFALLLLLRPSGGSSEVRVTGVAQRWSEAGSAQSNQTDERPKTPTCVNCDPCSGQSECLHLVDFDALKKRCDVYDNAVAAIYLTKRGHMDAAQAILDTFLRLMYRGIPSGRTLTLLAASYECDTDVPAGTYQEPLVMDGAVDSGNNAWAAIAFAHFAAASGQGCYRTAAEDILRAISIAGSCADAYDGFLARLPPLRGNQRSLEHNIDIYALAGMLGQWSLRDRAERFVQSMFGKNKAVRTRTGFLRMGGSAANCREQLLVMDGDGVNMDGQYKGTTNSNQQCSRQFWNILANAEPDPDRVGKLVSWLIYSDGMWEYDKDLRWRGHVCCKAVQEPAMIS
eukprot:Skav213954  [mRNA]  locus=scaffold1979:178458:186567:- [translate_table: standard]